MATRKSDKPRPRAAAPRIVQASTFKATCLELMDEVEASRIELVVTKHGRPVVKIGPVDAASDASPFGFMKGTVLSHGDIMAPDHDAWRASGTDPLDEGAR